MSISDDSSDRGYGGTDQSSDEDGISSAEKRVSREMCANEENTEEDLGIDTAYSKILSKKSMLVLSEALPPSDARKLLIRLGVPDATRKQHETNHRGDIVTATYESLCSWIQEKERGNQQKEVTFQRLYTDLLNALQGVGRNDVKDAIEGYFEMNKQLEKKTFQQL